MTRHYLNSTMVRLQLIITAIGQLEKALDNLNSTMVRLQRVFEGETPDADGGSQFHYGSITTIWYPPQDEDFDLGVISIPLWFDYNFSCIVKN